jgi:hypothetical protein
MLPQQLKLYFKSKANLLILFALGIIVALSYYESHCSDAALKNSLQGGISGPEAVAIQSILDGSNGLSYFINFLFSSDYLILTVLVLGIGTCAVASTTNAAHRSSGYGSLLVSRMGYQTYLRNISIAQIIYHAVFVFTSLFLVGAISMVVSPPNTSSTLNVNIGIRDQSLWFILLIALLQCILITLYITLSNLIAALSSCLIANKWVVQIIPLFLFFVPFFVAILTTGLNAGSIVLQLAPSSFLISLGNLFSTAASTGERCISIFLLPSVLLVGICCLYAHSIRKYRVDYL